MWEAIEVLVSVFGVWAALGVGAKVLGIAPDVKEGMKKVAKGVAEECGISSTGQQTNITYAIDEWQIQALTDKLKVFFGFLVLESASSNAHFIHIVYRCDQTAVGMDVFNLVFQNFLREKFNLPADAPLSTAAFLQDERLILICGLSDEGKNWVQVQRNNQRSRQIWQNNDLVE